jgi:hypothetical protein
MQIVNSSSERQKRCWGEEMVFFCGCVLFACIRTFVLGCSRCIDLSSKSLNAQRGWEGLEGKEQREDPTPLAFCTVGESRDSLLCSAWTVSCGIQVVTCTCVVNRVLVPSSRDKERSREDYSPPVCDGSGSVVLSR